MYNICVFSTKFSYRWVKKCEKLEFDNINLHFFIYDDLSHLEKLFIENIKNMDGFVFSAQIPYLHIQRQLSEYFTEIPCSYFDITVQDFYYKLAEISYNYPEFSIKHCMIDFLYKENNYLNLKEIIRPEDFPYILSDSIDVYGQPNPYKIVYETHAKLWEEQRIRFSLTRLSNLYTYFEDEHITPIVVTPTLDSMKSTIVELVSGIELDDLMNNQVVAGYLEFSMSHNDPSEIEYRQIALYKSILDFNRERGTSLITSRNAIHYELITNYSEFLTITNNQEICSLAEFLKENLTFKVKIGWGIGKTLQDARIQAEKASTYCTGSQTESYILTKENELLGPLDGHSSISINYSDNDRIEEIANDTNISLIYLQKIYGLIYKLKMETLTAEELSIHLSVTVRTASRILKRLEECNYASSSNDKGTHGKGRPQKVYKFNF
ncbi:helix-turn-helix domain-containing protein [Ureibacillus manganicus]|uniref:Helix-turn-helix type 11 domain-containing protein n=1 Tax=Ureibacillus manganicus DSM 26584 TaxID=1384049 RepID=A0A0A3HMN2_9BACL|nr:hypothetical protein [Ureibacillus manganicus]KGR73644.1 hypothetical protein CD29_19135 [Ureibacillus manganicus DSM 26584]